MRALFKCGKSNLCVFLPCFGGMDHSALITSKVELLKMQIHQSLAWVGKFVRTGKWKAVGDHKGKTDVTYSCL